MRSQSKELRNQALIKSINRAKILNCIRENKTIARAQIAEKLGLDRKSLTNFVSELQEEGLVFETGKLLTGSLGRPFTMLEFAKDKLVLGIMVSPETVHCVRMDLYGNIVHSSSCKDSGIATDRNKLLGLMQRLYFEQKTHGPVLGSVSISVPGLVNEKGLVVEAVNIPSAVGINFKTDLSFIKEPVLVEDSSRSLLRAEKWFGVAKGAKDVVFVEIGTGVGAGIMINNRLHAGGGYFSGEIGHVSLYPDGDLCRCGKRGCLETCISTPVVMKRINSALKSSYESLETVPDDAAATLEPILAEAGAKLGAALAMLINILSPNQIVLSGALISKFGGIVIPAAKKSAASLSLKQCFESVRIMPSSLANISGIGAGILALSEICEVNSYYHVGD